MSQARANLEVLPKSLQLIIALGFLALVVFPLTDQAFYSQMIARMMILAIFAMSLDLLQGVTGLVSLGHAAYFGFAGYVLAFITPDAGPISLWWSMPVAVCASALLAMVIGFFVVRTHGIYFIMVTMAFSQMIFYLFFDNKILGGSDGIYINFKPDAHWFDLENKTIFYYFVFICMLSSYFLLRRILWSPFGRTLSGIRINEHRMRALGYNTFAYKLSAFTLAGAFAGLAGFLGGAQSGYVNPELMGFHMSAHVIMMLILGGMGNFAGAILGAFSFELLLYFLKDLPTVGRFEMGKHWQLWMGLVIVLIVVFAPRGLLGLDAKESDKPMSQAVLEAVHLTKRFGGLAAVNRVSVTLHHNHLHAVIGPNGAGKTTLTHLLSGDLLPTEGQVLLNGQDVTRWSPEKLSHAGLGRSYQKINIFAPLTVWENVRLAAQSRFVQKSFLPKQWLGRALLNSQINELAHSSLEKTSLIHRHDAIAGATSHGEQRQLEIAMTLATQPQVLLLDEPLAGMGTAEAQRMIELLLELKKSHAMMLVEHDMDAVFALADQLTVMVNGQVTATGKPNDVRSDPLVQAAYLGETTS